MPYLLLAFLVILVAGAALGSRFLLRALRGESGRRAGLRRCPGCRSAMLFVGVEQFEFRARAEGWPLLFTEFAQIKEGLPLEVYTCPVCRRVDMALPPAAEFKPDRFLSGGEAASTPEGDAGPAAGVGEPAEGGSTEAQPGQP